MHPNRSRMLAGGLLALMLAVLPVDFGCDTTEPPPDGDDNTLDDTVDMAGEALVVVRPNGGEAYAVGSTMSIRWGIDFSRITNGVNFMLSANAGRSWAYIDPRLINTVHETDSQYYAGGHWGTFQWQVTDSMWADEMQTRKISIISDSCKLKIYAPYDLDSLHFRWYEDASDAVFSIGL